MGTGTRAIQRVAQALALNYTKCHTGRGVMKTPVVMATIMFVKNKHGEYLGGVIYSILKCRRNPTVFNLFWVRYKFG